VLGNLGANVGDSEYQFMRWFDLIGVQRHLKVLGIFARLWHRDRKIGYLADLPLTLEYVRDACRRYPELVEFERWMAWRVAPLLPEANARQVAKSAHTKPVRKKRVAAKAKSVSRKPRPKKPPPKKPPLKKKKRFPAKKAARKRRVSQASTRRLKRVRKVSSTRRVKRAAKSGGRIVRRAVRLKPRRAKSRSKTARKRANLRRRSRRRAK
jgi:hypothetical protein